MTVHDIVANLVTTPAASPGGGSLQQRPAAPEQGDLDGQLDRLLLAFEAECQSRFGNAGSPDHFTGLLCTVLAAEILVCYCATLSPQREDVFRRRKYRKMLSCLYSNDTIGLVVCNPTENHGKLKAKLEELRANSGGQSSPSQLERTMYTVSAVVQIGGNVESHRQEGLPLFGSPREFLVDTHESSEQMFVAERFEEADLLPIFSMAMTYKTLPEALAVVFGAFHPQDPSLTGKTQIALNRERTWPIPCIREEYILMIATFARAQFERGVGSPMMWVTDAALVRNAKLDLEAIESLVSSNVIGLFGSLMNPISVLFQQLQIIGVFSTSSRDYTLLSQTGDFFEAGIEYSNFEDPMSPLTAEPIEESPIPSPPDPMTADKNVGKFINSPSNVSLFPLNPDPSQAVPQKRPPPPTTPANPPPAAEPESPSFFSPSFADHLTSSNRHDPRIHTVNIPFHLNTPTRSQSYPTTPSPVRASQGVASQFSIKGRSSSTLRPFRRTSEFPTNNIVAIYPLELTDLLSEKRLLVLDIRAYAAYAKSRVAGAINVCIPTVLLKRPSLSLDDITESIVSKEDRGRFAKWKEADGIVIYDSDSLRVKEAYPLATLAGKFLEAGFEQPTYGITGGFASLLEVPSLIDPAPLANLRSPKSSLSPPKLVPSTLASKPMGVEATTRLALECKESPLFTRSPTTSQALGPTAFFSNIRQNMDLHGGVGPQIPIHAPPLSPRAQTRLPAWLRNVAYGSDGAAVLSQRWEAIELAEKARLEKVLMEGMDGRFSIRAAMERGEKNRYPNIWPFEWNRVKLPGVEEVNDYFNGSYVHNGLGRRRYIATQAPLPTTSEDFWKVVWAEGVQIIVCLTALEENGQVKCHPYWQERTEGEIQVLPMSEKIYPLGSGQTATLRPIMLQNHAEPFSSLREIIQIHYEGWPDFGTPAEAKTIVNLVSLLNDLSSRHSSPRSPKNPPVVVHCSAGCGRTGAFCTVDGILDYLSVGAKVVDEEDDLVFRSVREMREQRMSLVQTLRQYVLCYDCILYQLMSGMGADIEEEEMQVEGTAAAKGKSDWES